MWVFATVLQASKTVKESLRLSPAKWCFSLDAAQKKVFNSFVSDFAQAIFDHKLCHGLGYVTENLTVIIL